MSDTLYLQLEQNIKVTCPHVYLQDIAELACSNAKVLNRLRVMPVACLDAKKPGRYVMSVTDLIKEIQKKEPDLTITHMGEPEFIITYQAEPMHSSFLQWIKIIIVCAATFFGGAFSIMTFNNDVDVTGLFEKIYQQVTGSVPAGISVMEITYSLGLGLGILFFFNHFGRIRFSQDPSPMEVKMREYEDSVNNAVIEDINRKNAKSASGK